MPEDAVPARRGNSELGATLGIGLQERVFFCDDVTHHLQRLGDEWSCRSGPDLGTPAVRLLPERPPLGLGGKKLIPPPRPARGTPLPQGTTEHPPPSPHPAPGSL